MGSDADRALSMYVQDLITSGALVPGLMERAFRAVPRHRFVDHWYRLEALGLQATWEYVLFDRDDPNARDLAEVYSNTSLVTKLSGCLPSASSSEPVLVSRMLEILEIEPGMKVLEIGTGTGYNAALLAELVGEPALVSTIEIQQDVAESARGALDAEGYGAIRILHADGVGGFAEGAPFDRIEATVGCSDLSPHWLRQLADGGRILLPLQHGHLHPLLLIEPSSSDPGRAVGKWVDHASFMAIQGAMACVNPWQSFILGELPRDGARRRPIPVPLPAMNEGKLPLTDPEHRAFHFFLSLSSRRLWSPLDGYGLADVGGRAIALVVGDEIEIRERPGETGCGDRLAEDLVDLLERWERLGRPNPDAYQIEFVPKVESPVLGTDSGNEWVIERIHYWEIVRLP